MSYNKFTNFLENFYSYSKIPLICLQNNKLFFNLPKSKNLLPLINTLYSFNSSEEQVSFTYHFDCMFLGKIRITTKNTSFDLFIGPIMKQYLTVPEIENITKHLNLSIKDSAKIIDDLLVLKPITFDEFINLLIFLNYAINGNSKSETDILSNYSTIEIKKMKSFRLSKYKNDLFMEKLKRFVSKGDHLGLTMFSNFYPNTELELINISTDLRSYKNNIIFYLSKISEYAINAGLESKSSDRIAFSAISKIEKSTDYVDIEDIFQNTVKIYFDKINNLKINKNYKKIVKLAIIYIHQNIEKQLLVNEIATKLNVNRSYLSKCFVEDTSITIQNYIIQEKLKYGADLLKTTNHSVTKISELLSFSNQSHFQNSFKKYYHMTPIQYRKENQKLKYL